MSTRRIAELAGLSATTVSLALRNHPKIPAATRQRVLRIAQRLGYRPNAKVAELMAQLRLAKERKQEACFGLISLYEHPRPWEQSPHFLRIHAGMTSRAEALGYRLEPFWLRAPGMTHRRLRGILDVRGIQGLLCFGSPNLDDELPREFHHYAIVTQGFSIGTPMHRVLHNVSNDMWRLLKKLHGLGYRRPGLVIGDYEGARSAHAYLCVYLGWSQLELGTSPVVPVLHLSNVEEKPLMQWYAQHRPDVMIFIHHHTLLAEFAQVLRSNRLRVPDDVGVAVVSQILEGTGFSGMESNQQLMGAWAVELLVSRIMNQDFGVPRFPRVEMVDCRWVEGSSLRALAPSA
jgi:DNA-binding LacI/PurR family transcriptional regulator